MNPKYFPWIIIALAVMLVFSIYQNFNQGNQIDGLQAGQKLINENFEDQKKENFILMEKLEGMDRSVETEKILSELKDLKSKFKTTPRYDKAIDSYTDLDSIAKLFTEHYPNNP